MEILKEKPVPQAVAKASLRKRKKSEFGYEQKLAWESLHKHTLAGVKESKKLFAKLKEIGRIKEKWLINLVNLLPETKSEANLILEKSRAKPKEIKKASQLIKSVRES